MTDDIVARLRQYRRLVGGEVYPEICGEAADEIERLRKERDEARREVCAFASGRYRKDVVTLDRAATIEEAKRRGWDCFKDGADD